MKGPIRTGWYYDPDLRLIGVNSIYEVFIQGGFWKYQAYDLSGKFVIGATNKLRPKYWKQLERVSNEDVPKFFNDH